MFGTIYRYEIRYHLSRPVTWLYFMTFALGAFALMATDAIALIGGSGQVMRNAPWLIVRSMLFLVLMGQIVIAGLIGSAVLRDYQYRTHELLFTTPLTRFAYLGGRFAGAFTVMVLIHLGIVVGIMAAALAPWIEPERLLPFQLTTYLVPFAALVVPAVLVISAIFFSVGALTRNAFAVHTQGILLLVAWIIAQTLIGNLDDQNLAAMLDPIGLSAFDLVTRYWTVAEKNAAVISIDGVLLANRLLWTGIALALTAVTYLLFRFRSAPPSLWRSRQVRAEEAVPASRSALRLVSPEFGPSAWWVQFVSSARMSFRSIVRQVPFAVIVTVGMINLLIAAAYADLVFGQRAWPLTYNVVESLDGQFLIFFFVLIALYAGEVVWRERDLRADQVVDALPAGTSATMLGKVGGLILVQALLLLVLIAAGVVFQSAKGYFRFELGLYFAYLFGTVLPLLVQLTVMAVLIHVVVNHKYFAHALVILGFIVRAALGSLGIEHPLLQYGKVAPRVYSDMNGFGPFVPGLVWNTLYWSSVALLLGVGAYLLWIRGSETSWSVRLRAARARLRPSTVAVAAVGLIGVISAGSVLLVNIHSTNTYRTSAEQRRLRAEHERTYKRYAGTLQPRLVDADVRADLVPEELAFGVSATFTYVNNHPVGVDTLVVTLMQRDVVVDTLVWSRAATSLVEDHLHGMRLFVLEEPLAPNDSITLRYRGHYASRGFPVTGVEPTAIQIPIRNAIAANGSFLNFEYFPVLGYTTWRELQSDLDRRKEGLPPRVRAASIDDTAARAITYLGINASWINFRATVSTAPDQIALAPGTLIGEFAEGGRRVFEYRSEQPMLAFYSFLSARYEVRRDQWNGVGLEVYYHKDHGFNVDRMMDAMKASLADFSARFGPYQFPQLRIVEFPRYSQFAQAFPGTVPFSENIGFILRAGTKADDIDTPYYVTAHEVAHQWWFHQVIGGNVQGATMLSEALANYSAILVMEKTFGRENIRKFLREQLDQYLAGRGREAKAEQPLMLVENQPYIHYNKGSVALFALRELIGDEAMTRALSRFVRDKAFQAPPYTTSRELLAYLGEETPDSVHAAIDDLFRTITLWDNAIVGATATQRADGRYEVALDLRTAKFRADSLGNESPTPMADLIEIAVLGAPEPGAELGRPLYRARHRLGAGDTTLRVTVDGKPSHAGIDPYNTLIDRNPRDNLMPVRQP
ncbi:MAG: hypothetical protein KF785_00535 [Gemmatimonadales bacterium]|nr:hypothetical protein [Gemmatimonadales bacterium]